MSNDFDEQFRQLGFLSSATAALTSSIRQESGPWFELADRANETFQGIAIRAAETCTGLTAGDPKVVTALLALRCASAVQGVLLLAERGMAVEARSLIRSLIENALCLGALHDQPTKFLDMLWKDSDASRKAQGNFILAHNLVPGGDAQRARLEDAIAAIEKVRNLSIKEVSELSPLRRLYLSYRVLSNDSSYPSARSLSRYLRTSGEGSGWMGYLIGPAKSKELDDSLLLLLQGLTAAGVAITQVVGDIVGNAAIGDLSVEMRSLAEKSRLADEASAS